MEDKEVYKKTHRQHTDLISPSFYFSSGRNVAKIRLTSKQVALIRTDYVVVVSEFTSVPTASVERKENLGWRTWKAVVASHHMLQD
jgi:hypothetical protein